MHTHKHTQTYTQIHRHTHRYTDTCVRTHTHTHTTKCYRDVCTHTHTPCYRDSHTHHLVLLDTSFLSLLVQPSHCMPQLPTVSSYGHKAPYLRQGTLHPCTPTHTHTMQVMTVCVTSTQLTTVASQLVLIRHQWPN